MLDLKYSEILKLNRELGGKMKSENYNVTILSNIIVSQNKEILEYSLRTNGINANITFGDYDNIVQDSQKYKDSNALIIFWELCNILDGLHYKIELYEDFQFTELLEKIKSEIDFVLKNVESTSIVLINKFTSIPFSYNKIRKNKMDELALQLNSYLEKNITLNIKLVEIEKVIASIGITRSFDMRYYFLSKALYTIDFLKMYADYIKPFILSACGMSKKALIFDCDNTLWKGILGEDGFDNIEMSNSTKDGNIFAEIQSMALAINKQGILIGICSKNNLGDVEEVIKSHPDMQLRGEHITINKSNWFDKASNLKEIAQELNIGLNSIIFVDDSPFEVNLIREQIPEITVLQVPEKLYEYPKMLSKTFEMFYSSSITIEDTEKAKMYKHQRNRESSKKKFANIKDYLISLELRIKIYEDDESIIPRMSQMSQKTNQFNLTTKRYTEGDLNNFIRNIDSKVYAFSIADRFGDYGVTGLCIIVKKGNSKVVEIDTLLMSCRTIGRNIEYVFMDYLIKKIKESKRDTITAKYIKSSKNEQVKDFYDRCSFNLVSKNDSEREYVLDRSNYKSSGINYIRLSNE